MPQLWIIGGPNGAGKTTIANRFLESKLPVISADSIAVEEGRSPIQAGKAAIREQIRLLAGRNSFAVDTTLSGNRELSLMESARRAGYKTNLVFVCVEDPSVCNARIVERVKSGGHDVPRDDVARRYERSLANLPIALDKADRAFILDNTGEKPRLLLSIEHGRVRHIASYDRLPSWAIEAVPERLMRSKDVSDPQSELGRKLGQEKGFTMPVGYRELAPNTVHGQYTGKVLDVDGRYVYQDAGGRQVARHERACLNVDQPAKGQTIQVRYNQGRATVKDLSREQDLGLGR